MNYKKYSAIYFLKFQKIIKKNGLKNEQVAQFSFRSEQKNAYFCGMKFVNNILKKYKKKIIVSHLPDGTKIFYKDVVLEIIGDYGTIIHLEGIICGILARSTRICTNVKKIACLVNIKKIIFAADRNDYFLNQPLDGYSAYIGGIRNFVSNEQVSTIKNDKTVNVVGTIPHAAIQSFNGDLIKISQLYMNTFPNDNFVCLVDYENDVINTSLKICKKFGKKIFGVRVDTAVDVIDNSFSTEEGKNKENYGPSPLLIKKLRKKLDENNFNFVKIIVSGSITDKKIMEFSKKHTPINFYLIGGFFLTNNYNFCCDLVKNNGKLSAKFNRSYKPIK